MADTSKNTPARCRMCGSRVWSARSLETGLGKECRRRLLKLLTTGSEVHQTTPQKPREVAPSASPVSVDPEAVRAAVVALRAAADALAALAGGAS